MKAPLHALATGLTLATALVLFASFNRNQPETPVASQVQETPPATTGSEVASVRLPQVITSVNMQRVYDFAGEVVPKENFDAMERLDRELSINSYWHSSTLLNLKSAHRFFPIIEPILKANGVPDDLKYIAVIESNLRNETSPAGAKGIWQFMKPTAEHYGLEINSQVDERLHLEKATEAACRYLKDYYADFGSWTLAAAAYNMGGPRVKRLLQEQKAQSYYDLNLGSETSRYVFRIIAMKEIMQDPEAFGFYVNPGDVYQPFEYQTVTVDSTVASWADFALDHGTSYRLLKVFNPWLIDNDLANRSRKSYVIQVPLSE